jgi:hypothetical protein
MRHIFQLLKATDPMAKAMLFMTILLLSSSSLATAQSTFWVSTSASKVHTHRLHLRVAAMALPAELMWSNF